METKFRIVETEEYTLAISDEKIKVGDITPYVIKWTNRYEFFNSNNGIRKSKVNMAKKVIAYKPKGNAYKLNLPLLPDVEPRGFDEFEYTEDDLRKAINMARGIKEGKETFTAEDISGSTEVCTYGWKFEFDEDEIIQSLKQPKWFVAEKEYLSNTGEWKPVLLPSEWEIDTQVRLKTTTINNKTLVGTYLN
jgi:hypothetical protein